MCGDKDSPLLWVLGVARDVADEDTHYMEVRNKRAVHLRETLQHTSRKLGSESSRVSFALGLLMLRQGQLKGARAHFDRAQSNFDRLRERRIAFLRHKAMSTVVEEAPGMRSAAGGGMEPPKPVGEVGDGLEGAAGRWRQWRAVLQNHASQCAIVENAKDTEAIRVAQDSFVRATELDNHRPDVWNNVGLMHLNFGKFDAARAIFAPIHDSFDQYLDATNNLAICCMGQGDETLATSLLQGVLMKDRCHLEAVNNYAVLLMRQHKFTYAAQLLEDAVTQDRRFSSLWNNLGVAYKHMGLYKEATKAFSKACRLEQNPTYSRLLELNLAASLVQNGEYQRADEVYQDVIRSSDGGSVRAFIGRGKVCVPLCFSRASSWKATEDGAGRGRQE